MPGGRPSKYHQCVKDLELVTNLALRGFTHEDFAGFYGVNPDTIYEWKKKHPEFSEAINKGGDDAIGKVAGALFKTAVGFTEKVKKTFQGKDGPVTVEVDVYHPPDKVAAFIYLKNRDRKRWKDKWPEENANQDNFEFDITIRKRAPEEDPNGME